MLESVRLAEGRRSAAATQAQVLGIYFRPGLFERRQPECKHTRRMNTGLAAGGIVRQKKLWLGDS